MAADLANEARRALLNVLRHGADALGRHRPTLFLGPANVVLVVVGIEPLAKGLNVSLLAFVREKRDRLLGRCRRARQRARPHGDVREELRRLEVVPALLQELVVKRLQASLPRLLLRGASTELRLRACERCLLRSRSQAAELLAGHHLALEILRSNTLLAHRRLHGVLVRLLVQGRDSLRGGETLLAHQLCALEARAVTTEGSCANGLRLLLSELLALLLLQPGPRGVNHRLGVRVLIFLNLLRSERPNSLRAAYGQVGGGVEVRLGHPSRLIDVLDACPLRLRQGRNEGIGVLAVSLKGLVGGGLCFRVRSVVSRHDFRRNLHALCSSRSFAAHVSLSSLCSCLPRASLRLIQEKSAAGLTKNTLIHPHLAGGPVVRKNTDDQGKLQLIRHLLAELTQLASPTALCGSVLGTDEDSLFFDCALVRIPHMTDAQ